MPVYPDVYALPAAVSSGATALSIPTAGRDFSVGGTVLLKTDESPDATSRMATIAGITGMPCSWLPADRQLACRLAGVSGTSGSADRAAVAVPSH
jgi:hypothetical protein